MTKEKEELKLKNRPGLVFIWHVLLFEGSNLITDETPLLSLIVWSGKIGSFSYILLKAWAGMSRTILLSHWDVYMANT